MAVLAHLSIDGRASTEALSPEELAVMTALAAEFRAVLTAIESAQTVGDVEEISALLDRIDVEAVS